MDWLSFCQAVLPALAALLFVWTTVKGARRVCVPALQADGEKREAWDKKATLTAGLLLFTACAGGAAFFALCALDANPGEPLEQALHSVFPTSMDADHYIQLAKYGYGAGEDFPGQYLMIVFFPLFPWLLRLVCGITGLGGYTAGLLIQPVLFAVGGMALYRIVQPRFGRAAAGETLVLLCLLPGSFFFAAPMTESLYFALSMLAFACMESGRPAAFAGFGFLAALTRSTGGLLAGAAGVLWLMRLRRKEKAAPWLAAALGPAAGTGAYLLLNWHCYGDCFAFSAIQKAHWSQGLGWVGDTLRYHLHYLVSWWESNRSFSLYVSLLAVVLILAQLLTMALCSKKMPVPWLAYSMAYLLVADGATWLLSAPRYALSLPFFPLGVVLLCKKRWQKAAVVWVAALIGALYLRKYLLYGPIY